MAPFIGLSETAYMRAAAAHAVRVPYYPITYDANSASSAPSTGISAPPRSEHMQSLWPYHTYKPVTWDSKYYTQENSDKQPTISSGVAAGVTIGIFFMVFIFTFGCRIYSQYVDRSNGVPGSEPSTPESVLSESVAADLWICGVPSEPPPPYDVAITMPTHNPNVAVTV